MLEEASICMPFLSQNRLVATMRGNKKKVLILLGILLSTASLIHLWNSNTTTVVNILHGPDPLKKLLEEKIQNLDNELEAIPFNLKNGSLMHLAMNGCACVGDGARIHFPFSNLLLPQISATQLQGILKDSNPQRTQQVRATEFKRFRERTYTAADSLIYAKPNSPLQYPTQGVEVRPTRTILIPGLSVYKASKEDTYLVNLTASKGTFNTAAVVDGVDVRGEGEMYISFASRSLATLNRQLQFVTYTNTHFHPNTADVVQFKAGTFQAAFTIKIRHPPIPKFFTPGPKQDYTISNLVTIATKTFLRYDKLQDLINSVRQFYPNITIIIADDTKDPKLVTGPYIEHYIMPFGKGWFAGRNLAVSQVTTKYVLWVDDDFIFTSNTKLEKMVDILEKTTLDLVGGAVREVTGYTATYRHMLSTDGGDEEGDCLHIRTGYHHVIDGFPNCVVTDAVINFFMARTEKVRQVGFDPRLARVGHLAFFTDGLGSLHVGSCDDVIVNHASKIQMMMPWGQSKTDKAYSKFRYQSDEKHSFNEYDLYYLKNHFKCVTSD